MTIDTQSGEIDWPDPRANAQPTISVTDAEGTTRTASWPITVTTAGFYFLDKVNGAPGNSGTLASPWRDILQIWSLNDPDGIVYFRSGTYSNAGLTRHDVGTNWERVEMAGSQPRIWLAYPGEAPSIDNGYIAGVSNGAFFRISNEVYFDGLDIRNSKNILFQSGGGHYQVYRNLKMHQLREGIDGSNPAAVMFLSHYAYADYYISFQDNEFFDLNGGGGIKVYSKKKMLWEDNVFRNSTYGPDLKAHCPRFEVRRNHFYGNTGLLPGVWGNMDVNTSGDPCTGEIRFNRINQPSNYSNYFAMDINQNGNARGIYIYRNTIVGNVRIRNVYSGTGPFRFYNNVIINNNSASPARITRENVQVPEAVFISDNLDGAPSAGIIDSSLNLTSAYSSSIGRYGHQLGNEKALSPDPPTGVTVE